MRSKAKMINYGIVYGLSDYGLADRLNIPREEAKAFIDAYLERFPRVAEFMERTIGSAMQLADDDRRARPADAGALDGRGAVQRDAGVAPEPAVMVEHPRRLAEQHTRQRERLAGVVGEQRALGQLGGRVQVRHGGRG